LAKIYEDEKSIIKYRLRERINQQTIYSFYHIFEKVDQYRISREEAFEIMFNYFSKQEAKREFFDNLRKRISLMIKKLREEQDDERYKEIEKRIRDLLNDISEE
jgi:gas vesicle protein